MKAIIETSFMIRENRHSTYYSFPVYSPKIEETLIRELEFLRRLGTKPFSLELKIIEEG